VDELRAAFVDLDHTLVNHTETLRRMAARVGDVLELPPGSPPAGELYASLHRNRDWLWGMGVVDPRRFWLSREVLLTVAAIARRDVEPDLWPAWQAADRCGAVDDPTAVRLATELLAKCSAMLERDDCRARIDRAYRALWDDPTLVVAHDDIPELMNALGDAGAQTYIVTEGDAALQALKFERVGLVRWVARDRLVTTDDVALVGPAAPLLQYESTISRVMGVDNEQLIGTLTTGPPERARAERLRAMALLRRVLAETPALVESLRLEELREGIRELYRVLTDAGAKSHPRFMRLLLNGLVREPARPLAGLRAILSGGRPVCRLQLLTIGDRYDLDLYPLMRLYGDRVLSIHIRRGKYQSQDWEAERIEAGVPAASIEVRDFRGIAKSLPTTIWRRAEWVDAPAIIAEHEKDTRLAVSRCLSFPAESPPHALASAVLG
jgi:phosphoglycolate phosphatase-like HAD superfamily hydrolase